MKRYVSIWFKHFKTDWVILHRKELAQKSFVLAIPDHGRKIITAASVPAQAQGVHAGMVVTDARALVHELEVIEDDAAASAKVLKRLAEWCIRFTPSVALDGDDALLLDVSGCTHLWGGEEQYLKNILSRLGSFGFQVRATIAGTAGAAWAIARFTKAQLIVADGAHLNALLPLPPAALRLETGTVQQLEKLGLRQVRHFISMQRSALERRFGTNCIRQINYALGHEEEPLQFIHLPQPYQERLPCLEPIRTLTGIEIALEKLLKTLCDRLRTEGKGLRTAVFKGYRMDGKTVAITIGTGKASHSEVHLHKLFALKFEQFEPGEGIELFILEAPKVEDALAPQTQLWNGAAGLQDTQLVELLDRLNNRFGERHVHRFLPAEHHWPERSIKQAQTLHEKATTRWQPARPRPLQLLDPPEPVEAAAPVPDYPPMSFRHKGKLHTIAKAEGPERIEQEWWLSHGRHRDYYRVEDDEGNRYWLFRSGHYDAEKTYRWFLHGFFA